MLAWLKWNRLSLFGHFVAFYDTSIDFCGSIVNYITVYSTIDQMKQLLFAGPWFNIKMSSYLYTNTHCGDEAVVGYCYLHNGISYTGMIASLYWTNPLNVLISQCHCWWDYLLKYPLNDIIYMTIGSRISGTFLHPALIWSWRNPVAHRQIHWSKLAMISQQNLTYLGR